MTDYLYETIGYLCENDNETVLVTGTILHEKPNVRDLSTSGDSHKRVSRCSFPAVVCVFSCYVVVLRYA
jgi:hypothetical protein